MSTTFVEESTKFIISPIAQSNMENGMNETCEDDVNNINEHGNENKESGWTLYLVFSVCSAVLGTSFMYGYNSGVVNPAYDVMSTFLNDSFIENHDHYLDKSELSTYWSLVVSFFVVGGILGSFWFPETMADKFGRKGGICYSTAIGAVGSFLCFISPFTNSYLPLMIGRVIVGFHSGIVMVIVPALLVELAPVKLRGACGSLTELTLVMGVVFANAVGLPWLLGTDSGWQYLFRKPFLPKLFTKLVS